MFFISLYRSKGQRGARALLFSKNQVSESQYMYLIEIIQNLQICYLKILKDLLLKDCLKIVIQCVKR